MAHIVSPTDESEVRDAVLTAASAKTPLEVRGGGTRRGLGRQVAADTVLSTVGLAGITLYEPAELVLSARSGTAFAEIEAVLNSRNQRLAFEPPDYRFLLGTSGEPTIGGTVAVNASGPRRVNAGACRDELIGVRMVTGRGEVVRSGGRVMKNVTGYDLVKLSAGAYGTLGILTEVTFKLLPQPQSQASLVLRGLTDGEAVAAMLTALGSPYEVTGAAHLPAMSDKVASTYFRLEGFDSTVKHRSRELALVLALYGHAERMDEESSRDIWSKIRDVQVLPVNPDCLIWRVSTKASQSAAFVEGLLGVIRAHFYDWGGALVWLAVPPDGDGGASTIRSMLRRVGGHATLVRAPDHVGRALEVFEPQAAPIMDLSRKIKHAFDPQGVINPGRMYPGI